MLLPDSPSIGSAQIEEIRQAMRKLRSAGKDIYVHADSLTMREYVLLSGATRLSVVPTVVRSGEAFNVVPADGELLFDMRAARLEAFKHVLAAVPAAWGWGLT